MKNYLVFIALLLLCSMSCTKKTSLAIDHTAYASTSHEIENSWYAKRDATPLSTEQTWSAESPSFGITQKHSAATRRKAMLKKVRADREVPDTIVNDEENYQRKNRVSNKNSNLALTFGLLALIPLPTAYLFGILAMVFGIIGLSDMHKEPLKYKGKGKAIFGISIGTLLTLALIVGILYIILI